MHTHSHTHTCNTHVRMHTHTCNTHVRTHTHTHTHTCTHTQDAGLNSLGQGALLSFQLLVACSRKSNQILLSYVYSVSFDAWFPWNMCLQHLHPLSCTPQRATSLTANAQKQYASAGAVAEEVLSSIRTVVAFGGEQKEVDRSGCVVINRL